MRHMWPLHLPRMPLAKPVSRPCVLGGWSGGVGWNGPKDDQEYTRANLTHLQQMDGRLSPQASPTSCL